MPTKPAGELLVWLCVWRFLGRQLRESSSFSARRLDDAQSSPSHGLCCAHPLSQHLCPCPAPPSTSGAFTFRWQDEAHTLGSCALKAAKGFTRSYWGEHHSAVILPQCRVPYCTAYAQGTCRCTACQQGWLPSTGKCVSVSSSAGS